MSGETNHYHTKISDIADSEFRQLIGEICGLAKWRSEDAESGTLFDLLQFIGAEKRAIRFKDLPRPGILANQISSLPGGVVLELCVEIAKERHMNIAPPSTKTVFSVIKEAIPTAYRPKRLTRIQQMDLEQTRFILQQRANRTL